MKNIKIDAFIFCAFIFAILSVTACDDNNDDVPQNTVINQPSRISVRFSGITGDYDEVNLEVVDVLIDNGASNDNTVWVSIGINHSVVYNILNFTGDANILIADKWVPPGNLGTIQLLLGEKNTIVKGGVTYPLTTSIAEWSGLKLPVNQPLQAGLEYNFVLDFDVDKSIVKTNNPNQFILKPVIRLLR